MKTREHGIALILVILVLLVLSVLGITASVMMTQEDKTSSRQDLQRSAFYVAEVGLRTGEGILTPIPYSNDNLNNLLIYDSTAQTQTPAMIPARPVVPPGWDLGHLGTYLAPGGVPVVNREVPIAGSTSGKVRAFYSLCVRNNPDDPGITYAPPRNLDSRLRLISVAFITDSAGVTANTNVLAVKILEEEINWTGWTQGASNQKLGNAAGTSSAIYAGT
jgi:hypothetical protein